MYIFLLIFRNAKLAYNNGLKKQSLKTDVFNTVRCHVVVFNFIFIC
jgi:hypothetical protein